MDDLQRERADGHKVRDLHLTREYICQREVTLRFELHPGTYCIVPAAFTPGAEAAFLLRLAADGPLESRSQSLFYTISKGSGALIFTNIYLAISTPSH